MGDKAKFAEDAMPLMQSLYLTAYRLTHDKHRAEDLVQEAYLRAYRSYESFIDGTNLKAWMYRILTNAFINDYRAKQRRPQESDLADTEDLYIYRRLGTETANGLGRSAEDEVMDLFTEQDVVSALQDLREEYRVPVLLADVEEFSYKEIAEILDIPMGTVMSRLHRGRNSLQKALFEFATARGLISRGQPAEQIEDDLPEDQLVK